MPAIAVSKLEVERGGHPVLNGSTSRFRQGGFAVCWPSGCGKSTLMRAIVGVQIVASGAFPCWASRPARRRCGAASATSRRRRRSTAISAWRRTCASSPRSSVPTRRIGEVIETVGLGGFERQRRRARSPAASAPGSRSRRRCSAGPTSSCSTSRRSASTPSCARELWETFHELAAGGTTLLVSSHVMDEAGRMRRAPADARRAICCVRRRPTALRARDRRADLSRAFLALIERAPSAVSAARHSAIGPPGALADPPRSSHDRAPARRAGRAPGAAEVRVRGPAADLPVDRRAACAASSPSSSCSSHLDRDAARAHDRHARAPDDAADGQARPAGRLRRSRSACWRRSRRPSSAWSASSRSASTPPTALGWSACSRSATPSSAWRSACS